MTPWQYYHCPQGQAVATNTRGTDNYLVKSANNSDCFKPPSEAVSPLINLRQKTETDQLYRQASAYIEGNGVVQDYREAFALMKKSADMGNETAMYMVGRMLASGMGTHNDDAEAVKYWISGSILGDTMSQGCVISAYLIGKGTEPSRVQAAKWTFVRQASLPASLGKLMKPSIADLEKLLNLDELEIARQQAKAIHEIISAEHSRTETKQNPSSSYRDSRVKIEIIQPADYERRLGSLFVLLVNNMTTTSLIKFQTHRVWGFEFGSDFGGRTPAGITVGDSFGNDLGVVEVQPSYTGHVSERGLPPGETMRFRVRTTDAPVARSNFITVSINRGVLANENALTLRLSK